jgi:hypothetical protein
MREVGRGFGFRADRKTLRHCTEAESGDLREDEPHPMATFSTGGQLFRHLGVNGGLSFHKTAKFVRICVGIRCHRNGFQAERSGPFAP